MTTDYPRWLERGMHIIADEKANSGPMKSARAASPPRSEIAIIFIKPVGAGLAGLDALAISRPNPATRCGGESGLSGALSLSL